MPWGFVPRARRRRERASVVRVWTARQSVHIGTVGDTSFENVRAADIARVSYVYGVSPGRVCLGAVSRRILVIPVLQLVLGGSQTIAAPPLCVSGCV